MIRNVCLFVFFIAGIAYSPKAAAQSQEVPEDSLLIAEYTITGIPENKDIDKIEDIISDFMRANHYRYDVYESEGGRVVQTFRDRIEKQLKFYDREIEMVMVYTIDEARNVTMKMYAREKMKSIKLNYWRITESRSRERLENLARSYYNFLNKKLTYKR